MTIVEKANVINDFCDAQCENGCATCKIDHICSRIEGAFGSHPDELEEACEIISKLNNETTEDVINHPNHYTQGGIECIDAMVSAFGRETVKHFCICNAFKYIFRHEHKNGQEDLDKAQWYLNKYKELASNE